MIESMNMYFLMMKNTNQMLNNRQPEIEISEYDKHTNKSMTPEERDYWS